MDYATCDGPSQDQVLAWNEHNDHADGAEDVSTLAASLAEAARNLEAHVESRAEQIAAARGGDHVYQAFRANQRRSDLEAVLNRVRDELGGRIEALTERAECAERERDEARAALAQIAVSTDYTRYEPGPDQDGLATLWCTDCDPSLDDVPFPIWVEPRTQVTPLSLANLIAAADEHERQCHSPAQDGGPR